MSFVAWPRLVGTNTVVKKTGGVAERQSLPRCRPLALIDAIGTVTEREKFWGAAAPAAMFSAMPRGAKGAVRAMTAGELESIRRSVNRGTPFDSADWIEKTAEQMGRYALAAGRGSTKGMGNKVVENNGACPACPLFRLQDWKGWSDVKIEKKSARQPKNS